MTNPTPQPTKRENREIKISKNKAAIMLLVDIARDVRSSMDDSMSKVSVANPIYSKEDILFYGKILYLLGYIEALGE